MTGRMGESFGKIRADELDEKAEKLGVALPGQYRDFLLRTNGGKPDPGTFAFVEGGRKTESFVQAMFCWGEHRYYSIDKRLSLFRTATWPKDMLPIGQDPGGNLICLAIRGPNVGQVWFWDQDHDPGGQNSGMIFVSKDINTFLASLY